MPRLVAAPQCHSQLHLRCQHLFVTAQRLVQRQAEHHHRRGARLLLLLPLLLAAATTAMTRTSLPEPEARLPLGQEHLQLAVPEQQQEEAQVKREVAVAVVAVGVPRARYTATRLATSWTWRPRWHAWQRSGRGTQLHRRRSSMT